MVKTDNLDKPLDDIIKNSKMHSKKPKFGDLKWKNSYSHSSKYEPCSKKSFDTHRKLIYKMREKKYDSYFSDKNKSIRTSDIMVSNISSNIKIRQIEKIFEVIGDIKDCDFLRNEKGETLGTVMISFYKHEHATKAMEEFDQCELEGRLLCIKYVNKDRAR